MIRSQTKTWFSFDTLLPSDRETWISILSPICFLLLWETTVRFGVLPANFFPLPSSILTEFISMTMNGELVHHSVVTIRRLLAAFAIAVTAGVSLGLLMGMNKTVRAILNPLVTIIYPIPKIALLPLTIIIFGFGDPSIIITASITAFFIILLNTVRGVLEIEEVLLEAGENFHAEGFQMFYKVILPGSMPNILTGLRLGLGLSLIVTVASEFVASEEGLGYLIHHSWQILQVKQMYVGFVAIGILGVITTSTLEVVSNRLLPWKDDEYTI